MYLQRDESFVWMGRPRPWETSFLNHPYAGSADAWSHRVLSQFQVSVSGVLNA
jgi:hypothetical protein